MSKEPYSSLYTTFRTKLLHEEIVIVLGYNFADNTINHAFRVRLNYDGKKQTNWSKKER